MAIIVSGPAIFWKNNFSREIYEINYENLVKDTDTEIKKLINDAGYEAVQRTTEYDLIEVTSKAI